jgi:hypothetical protein
MHRREPKQTVDCRSLRSRSGFCQQVQTLGQAESYKSSKQLLLKVKSGARMVQAEQASFAD